MKRLREATLQVKARLRTPRGRNFLTFMAFLGISTVLWFVLVINDEVQRELRCGVKITNKPDSVVIISDLPEAINVSVRAKGSILLKHDYSGAPTVAIDFQTFRSGNRITLGATEMRGIVRTLFGASSQVLNVAPDSINLLFTTRKPLRLPVKVDAKVSVSPQCTMAGPIVPLIDSVDIYSVRPISSNIKYIYTEPIRYDNLDRSEIVNVKLIAPSPDTRIIPGHIDVKIPIESLISKSRKVMVTPVNVPSSITMSTFPPMVEVNYMVPMSLYNEIKPDFIVEADYNDIRKSNSNMIPLKLRHLPAEFQNVYLAIDSVEYVIERH